MDLETIKADLQSFSDDDADVIVDRNGEVLFFRNHLEIQAKIIIEPSTGNVFVEYNDDLLTYRQFLAKSIARLDVFAERLISKRKPQIINFIEGPGSLQTPISILENGLIKLLNTSCTTPLPFSSKVVFVTADAGHGKTALLKEYQYHQAQRYLSNQSHFLFWHVDLQGRQLLRLSEALMGDLGELRVPSLWMSSIITLLRRGLLVLAIDGFDELAAEIGSMDALGSLSTLISSLNNEGIIIAASRRTFFDTEDYISRTKVLRGKVDNACQFDEIRVKDWQIKEIMEFIRSFSKTHNNCFPKAEDTYADILISLDYNEYHPILVRPFLLSKLLQGLNRYNLKPKEFLLGMRDVTKEGLASIVEAFIQREVKDKWRISDTGEPYLTFEQHLHLLASVAEEMWQTQVDLISIDAIQFITTILCDEWKISDDKLRSQIVEMASMHAFLVVPPSGDFNYRQFDHPEFKDYFISVSLAGLLDKRAKGSNIVQLKRFLSHSILPETVANYAVHNLDSNSNNAELLLRSLEETVVNEWKPTYLQLNIGTIVPFILNNNKGSILTFSSKVTYSSLSFEDKIISNVKIENGSFINTSFLGTSFYHVILENCFLSDVSFDEYSKFVSVELRNCEISSIKLYHKNEISQHIYAPDSITKLLQSKGIMVTGYEQFELALNEGSLSEARKSLDKLLRIFRRTTSLTSYHIENKFQKNQDLITKSIIPLMIKYGLLEERPSHIQGYVLKYSLEQILRMESKKDGSSLSHFWSEFKHMENSV